jgi:hypothetical protein
MPLVTVAAWTLARYRSVPSIVLRAVLAELLSFFDLASDLYTIDSLFTLGHDGPASALLTMVYLSFAFQVRALCADAMPHCPTRAVATRRLAGLAVQRCGRLSS